MNNNLTLQKVLEFTENNHGYQVSLEDGKIQLLDWTSDPNLKIYNLKTFKELSEIIRLIEDIGKFQDNRED